MAGGGWEDDASFEMFKTHTDSHTHAHTNILTCADVKQLKPVQLQPSSFPLRKILDCYKIDPSGISFCFFFFAVISFAHAAVFFFPHSLMKEETLCREMSRIRTHRKSFVAAGWRTSSAASLRAPPVRQSFYFFIFFSPSCARKHKEALFFPRQSSHDNYCCYIRRHFSP